MPTLTEYALRYAELGWPVFPLAQGGKTPAGALAPHGFKDATRDADQIRAWWKQGQWNIGIPTGEPSGWWVLDVDPRNGGVESLEALMAQHGPLSTLTAQTGGGGTHYLFRQDPHVCRGKLGPGLDVKRDGGYIVVEPSRTQAGYAFTDWDVFGAEPPPIEPAPAWLLALVASKPSPEKAAGENATPWDEDMPRLRSALAVIPADAYDDWVRIGAALYHASAGALDALAIWDAWSATARNYEAEACAKRWRSFANYAAARATLGTVFFEAKARGWAWRSPSAAKTLTDTESVPPPTPAGAGLSAEPPWYAGVTWIFKGSGFQLADCQENVYLVLQHHPEWEGVLALDTFQNRIVTRKATPWRSSAGEWTEEDDFQIGLWLAQSPLVNGNSLLVKAAESKRAALRACASRHKVHPVQEYLSGLQHDREARMDHWLVDYLGVSPASTQQAEYVRLVGRMFLLGMVARAFEPGCIMRSVPILEGEQQRGKSTALRILGAPWFADTPLNLGDKDAFQALNGMWLYEISEMDAFNRAEATRVKAFVSSPSDRYRASYDDRARDWPRTVVFAASTNSHEYFKDPTGNTRFWPVPTGDIRLDLLAEMRDQLLAEAVLAYRAGERRYPTSEQDRTLFLPEQEHREVGDPWLAVIARKAQAFTGQHVTLDQVLTDWLSIEIGKVDNARQMATRIGVCMRKLGWAKGREASGAREYYYTRPASAQHAGHSLSGNGDVPF